MDETDLTIYLVALTAEAFTVPPAVWIAALWFLATGLVTQAVAQPAGTPPRPQWQALRVLKP